MDKEFNAILQDSALERWQAVTKKAKQEEKVEE